MNFWLLLPIITPIVLGVLFPFFARKYDASKQRIYLIVSVLLSAAFSIFALSLGEISLSVFRVNAVIHLSLQVDALGRFFAIVATLVWTLVCIYTLGFDLGETRRTRFFSSLLMSYAAIIGACFSANFFTLFLFYELLTLFNYPLIAHKRTAESAEAGKKYIVYSFLGAGLLIFVAFALIAGFGQSTDFTAGGVFSAASTSHDAPYLQVIFLLAFLGFGVKAYIWPLFHWVPTVYPVAPAPAAALLSGVGSKISVLALIRLCFFIFSPELLLGSWMQTLLLCLALLTIFTGSMLAFREKLLTRRLAYSSVSQLSYILFGIILLNPIALFAALLHVLFHAVMKVTLFLSAGAMEQQADKAYVNEMRGIGKAMPVTLWCFTIASLALIGIPPTSGFISKVQLIFGAMSSNHPTLGILGTGILLISALLTAGYLIPIFASAFFPGVKFKYEELKPCEANRFMTSPLIVLAALSLLFGLFPSILLDFLSDISTLLFY